MESHYEIADELSSIEDVADVQASEKRLIVVFAPDEEGVEQLPEHIASKVEDLIDETDWIPEYEDVRDVEIHEWGHGRSNPILSASEHTANRELQSSLVKSRF